HGVWGDEYAGDKIDDRTDPRTGLPVFSLYGVTRKPSPAMLDQIDVLVFDLQDIGSRSYTYISTMGLCMEAAAEKGSVEIIVLDRPNPLGGEYVAGPIADEDKLGFTAYRPIPLVHGMTVGELARLFNEHFKIGCKLTVIPVEGWKRSMWWDDTGLKWVAPSPNLRNPTQAYLYPAIGLLESSNISVGRGTDTPFEIWGAPYIRKDELAAMPNAMNLPGLRFEPITFTPTRTHHKFNDTECHGVRVIITDRAAIRPVEAGCAFAWLLQRHYREEWRSEELVKMLQNDEAVQALFALENPADAPSIWSTQLAEFEPIRRQFLLYE
ncbi:MAG TPA: DUF1343 domain-containing protein, partial [Tepidisphaeraceae bacterium]|nr:DUF1343 domain-containing protein [Tepidisphaeraceae bacterium]